MPKMLGDFRHDGPMNHRITFEGFWIDKEDQVHPYKVLSEGKIHIPNETLNISRDMMPQIGSDHDSFLKHLSTNGFKYSHEMVDPKTLKATQKEFSHKIIRSIIRTKPKLKPSIISREGYILDGHHRWLGHMNSTPEKKIAVVRVHTGILDLMAAANSYPKVQKRSLKDSEQRTKMRNTLKKTLLEAQEARLYK